MSWNSRFKQSSAAKRKAKEPQQAQAADLQAAQQEQYRRLVHAAHMSDLIQYMQSLGMTVKKDGVSNWKIDGGQYRVTRKPDGHHVWCSQDESRGGDPIDFCTSELGLTFQQSLADLSGERLVQQSRREPPKPREISAPPRARDPFEVIDYLQSRGISKNTVHQAQSSGFLKFVDYNGTPAAAFAGKDAQGNLRSMTCRLVRPVKSWDGEGEINKLDIRHSDKSFPAIFRGDKDGHVWIVEGGIDALALVDWYKRDRAPTPTVIVSGGASVNRFLDQPHIQQLLKGNKVYLAFENEKDQQTQERTDAAHMLQIEKMQAIWCEVIKWRPPETTKDLADAWQSDLLLDAHNQTEQKKSQIQSVEVVEEKEQDLSRVSSMDFEPDR